MADLLSVGICCRTWVHDLSLLVAVPCRNVVRDRVDLFHIHLLPLLPSFLECRGFGLDAEPPHPDRLLRHGPCTNGTHKHCSSKLWGTVPLPRSDYAARDVQAVFQFKAVRLPKFPSTHDLCLGEAVVDEAPIESVYDPVRGNPRREEESVSIGAVHAC